MESDPHQLDRTDLRLLREIVEDGRISDVALGEKVHLSSTAAARRRKILEERGMVPRYAASPDLVRLGYGIVVHVSIELVSPAEQVLNEFEHAVVKCPSIS